MLCPGPVPTEFAARADLSKSMAPAIVSLSAEHVAEEGYRGLMQGRRTVVPGLVNKLVILVIRIVPRRIVLALVDARQRRRRPAQSTQPPPPLILQTPVKRLVLDTSAESRPEPPC